MSTVDLVQGGIHPERLYPRAEIERMLGWGRNSFAKARSQGLKVMYIHRGSLVKGSDLIEYIEKNSRSSYR